MYKVILREATHTNCSLLFNWAELELTVSHTRGENGNHYTTEIWLSGLVREIFSAVVVFVSKKIIPPECLFSFTFLSIYVWKDRIKKNVDLIQKYRK